MRFTKYPIALALFWSLPHIAVARDFALTPLAPDAIEWPAIDGDTIVYQTQSGELRASTGGETRRIFGREQLPGVTFISFLSSAGDDVAFGTNRGDYVVQNSVVRPLLTDTGAHATSVPSADGDRVVYLAPGASALFEDRGGQVSRLYDLTTPVPGAAGQTFTGFGHVATRHGHLVFHGGSLNNLGIYTNDNTLTRIADQRTPIPGGSGNFQHLLMGFVQTDGRDVVFSGMDANGREGVYTTQGGTLRVVADRNTPVPGSSGTFQRFGAFMGPSIDDGNIVFYGQGSATTGYFLDSAGELSSIITLADTINGHRLSSLSTSNEALSGNTFVFQAGFVDQPSAIYVLTIPEPGFGLIAVATACLALHRRRPCPRGCRG